MTNTIEGFQTEINIGAEQSYKNLSMFPLLADHLVPSEYLTIDEALSHDPSGKKAMNEINAVPQYQAGLSDDRGFVAAAWDYIEQFARVDGQVGAVFLINGKIAGLVCLDGAKAFEKSFIGILECYAVKAVKVLAAAGHLKSLKSEVINFMRTTSNSREVIEAAV